MFEINEMYPAYLAVAKDQGETAAERSMTYAITAERIHAEMFRHAKRTIDGGSDVDLGDVHICPVCRLGKSRRRRRETRAARTFACGPPSFSPGAWRANNPVPACVECCDGSLY